MAGSLGSAPHVHFEVEKIIGISSDGNYQVQWAPAWVSRFHLVGCEHLIQEFLQQQTVKEEHRPETQLEIPPVSSQTSETLPHQAEITFIQSNSFLSFPDQTEKNFMQNDHFSPLPGSEGRFDNDGSELGLSSEVVPEKHLHEYSLDNEGLSGAEKRDRKLLEPRNNSDSLPNVIVKKEDEAETDEMPDRCSSRSLNPCPSRTHHDRLTVRRVSDPEIVDEEKRRNTPHVMQQISEEVQAARRDASQAWNQKPNKSNFDALKQMEDLFAKSKAFMQLTEVKDESESLKESALQFHAEGEKILKERLKIVKFADREGWKRALLYEGDDLAENEADEHRMKRSKKDADSDKDKFPERWRRDSRDGFTRQGSSNSRGRGGSRNPYTRSNQKYCTNCRIYGHISRDCYRR